MQFIVHNAGFLPSFSKKSFCGLSVKNQDILNNSETSPQVLILLCVSTCRSTTKSCPEDLQQSLRLTEPQSPYPAQLAMDAFGLGHAVSRKQRLLPPRETWCATLA